MIERAALGKRVVPLGVCVGSHDLLLSRADQELSTKLNQPKLLARLLQVCFEHFRNIVQAHKVLLTHLHQTRRAFKGQGGGRGLLFQQRDICAFVSLGHRAVYPLSGGGRLDCCSACGELLAYRAISRD